VVITTARDPIFSIDNPVPMIDMKHPPQIKGGGG
jgi:hypothetical protein